MPFVRITAQALVKPSRPIDFAWLSRAQQKSLSAGVHLASQAETNKGSSVDLKSERKEMRR
jgi:hypothetical protein